MNLRELELAIRKAKEAQHGKYGYGAKEAKELAKLITPDVADMLVNEQRKYVVVQYKDGFWRSVPQVIYQNG